MLNIRGATVTIDAMGTQKEDRFVAVPSGSAIRSLNDLRGKRVAVFKGTNHVPQGGQEDAVREREEASAALSDDFRAARPVGCQGAAAPLGWACRQRQAKARG